MIDLQKTQIAAAQTATPSDTPTWAPTWTPGPESTVCIAPLTPAPAQTGQVPVLVLIIPALADVPTLTPRGTITASLVISPAQTTIVSLMQPMKTITAWSSTAFGADGYARAQADTAPIVTGVSVSFGWLAVLGQIGPLAWLIPPILITVLVRAAKPILSLLRYIKQIIPVVG